MKKWFLVVFSFFVLIQTTEGFSKENQEKVSIYFFWGNGCPHCEEEKVFLEKLQQRYPNIEIYSFEVWDNGHNLALLNDVAQEMKINIIGIPVTIIGERHFIGYLDEKTTGKEIELAVQEFTILEAQQKAPCDFVKAILSKNKHPGCEYERIKAFIPETISVPFFGQIGIKQISLPLLTIVLGAIDGFNPCAMWVLIMLLSFLIAINDRKKMVLLGVLFVFASACIYFLFMVSWLNFLFFLSYIPWIKIIIGSVAIFGGGFYLREFWTNKDGTCKVTGSRQKRWIIEKLRVLTEQNRYMLACFGIVGLAFLVNLIELICSAGLPAIYVQVLSLTPLSTLQYYLYISLYIFVFMLDDLLIFLVAIFSLHMMKLTATYSRYSHLIGGIALLIVGTLLIFKPQWLMFG